MLSNIEVPIYKMPAKRAIKIIQESSGKPIKEIKKFYQGISTHEIKKLKSNSPYATFSKKEVKQLLRDTHKKGLFLSEEKIKKEFNIIKQEETKRKIEYSKNRTKLMERMEKLKSGKSPILGREIDRVIEKKPRSKDGRREDRADRIRDMIVDITLEKTEKKDKFDNNIVERKRGASFEGKDKVDNAQNKKNIEKEKSFHKKDIIDL
ncbi:MAG: hypothetical protein U9O55_04525 [Patescibacteria group bacterium]|nr:hypothetical protein [Patescibacteria group bacterium]